MAASSVPLARKHRLSASISSGAHFQPGDQSAQHFSRNAKSLKLTAASAIFVWKKNMYQERRCCAQSVTSASKNFEPYGTAAVTSRLMRSGDAAAAPYAATAPQSWPNTIASS